MQAQLMVIERQAELAVKEEDLRETRAELERTVLNLNRSRKQVLFA